MRASLLYVRRWRLGRQALVAVLCALLWVATPLRLYDVPARDGVQGALWPMAPALFAAFLPSVLATASEVQERITPTATRLRATTTGVVLTLAVTLALTGAANDPAVAFRNTLLLTGLAFMGCCLLPPAAAWAPPVAIPMVMWLIGTKPQAQVEPWSLLLLPGTTTYAWLTTALITTTAITTYLYRGPRP
ncbi:hypothetical protein [Streptomyces erythrochromogenes]|uniref:hypothetical protein n=1 Tax=Streptomyces erythrochromogenes TaxID=285574 RepID=UPI0038696D72|nr:hypothetical protein OG364_14060 [Streptomyces erythrochromogenes]